MIESIRFLNHEIEIKRVPRRRGLALYMHPFKKTQIKANLKVSSSQVLEFLMAHQSWIEKNLKKFQIIETQFKKPTLEEGSCYPYLGELKYLQFSNTTKKRSFFKLEDGFLVYYKSNSIGTIPIMTNEKDSEDFFINLKYFYKSEAEIIIKSKVDEWSKIMGLIPNKLKIRTQKSRWGSCSSAKHVNLNWKLICVSPVLIDYVIVHELCHLKHLNHSKDFWNLVEFYFPSYKESKMVLKKQEYFCTFLD